MTQPAPHSWTSPSSDEQLRGGSAIFDPDARALAPDREPVEDVECRDHGHAQDWYQEAEQGAYRKPGQGQPKSPADGRVSHHDLGRPATLMGSGALITAEFFRWLPVVGMQEAEPRAGDGRCYAMLPLGATVSGCQVLVPFTAQKNRRLLPAPTAAMLTPLPSVIMDGAE